MQCIPMALKGILHIYLGERENNGDLEIGISQLFFFFLVEITQVSGSTDG